MTLHQYNLLNALEQAQVLWKNGVHIAERFTADHRILLNQLVGFYVEVFYDPVHNKIERRRSFRSVKQLRPYLDQIDIRKLLLSL